MDDRALQQNPPEGRHADLLPARRRSPPTAITVGAHQTRLDTCALTLRGSPADTERRLRDLADQIIERTAA
jgi:hypothetical protein